MRKEKYFTVEKLKEKLEKLIKDGYGDKLITYDDQAIQYCEYESEMDCVVCD